MNKNLLFTRSFVGFALSVGTIATAHAALELASPINGESVPLLRDFQKEISLIPKQSDRLAYFAAHTKDKSIMSGTNWRTSKPLVFRFRDAENPDGPSWNGPWKVFIGKKPDLSDACVFPVWQDPSPGPNDAEGWDPAAPHDYRVEIAGANLEIGEKYYWKVSCRRRCTLQCDPSHGCERSKRYTESPIGMFVTEEIAPRWIALEGPGLFNVRDLGGRRGQHGRRIRQGKIFRGAKLNIDSTTGDIPGKNLLTAGDLAYMRDILGIKTILDLRTIGENGGMAESPLGSDVRLVHRSSTSYAWLFQDKAGGDAMAENFRLFCDPANYPIYFHCSGGADRTGSLAWVLNAVLGVARLETEIDWEVTFYPDIPGVANDDWRGIHYFDEGFGKYGDGKTPWDECVILFLKERGITDAEIEAFRSIMLEPEK